MLKRSKKSCCPDKSTDKLAKAGTKTRDCSARNSKTSASDSKSSHEKACSTKACSTKACSTRNSATGTRRMSAKNCK